MSGLWLTLLTAAQEAAHEAAAVASEHAPEAHGAAGAAGHSPSETLMHHVADERWGDLLIGPLNLGPTKHLFWFGVAALLVLVLVRMANASYKGRQPGRLGALVELFVTFIRDEIAEKNIGHDGRKFTPLLLSFFFFILVAALLGLVPFTATSTGNINVTMGLASVSFLAQQYAGISKFGIGGHFHNLVPPGLPAWLLPIMLPVEILGMFTKPFALMVRLFANMLAGHMVIVSLLMLVPIMMGMSSLGIVILPVSLGLSLFIMLLELLVALIQAYIFTLLSAIFIGMYAHPAH